MACIFCEVLDPQYSSRDIDQSWTTEWFIYEKHNKNFDLSKILLESSSALLLVCNKKLILLLYFIFVSSLISNFL